MRASSELAEVRPGEVLDWRALEAHLRAHVPDLGPGFAVQQFSKGAANLTYLVTVGDDQLVVRRPPMGQVAPGAHDMAREHKVTSRLSTGLDLVPKAILYCGDPDVIGAEFLVAEYRTGEVIRDHIPASMTHHDDIGRRVGLALIDGLAELHQVDFEPLGLADLGRPEGFLDRQLDGWSKRWAAVASEEADPSMAEIEARLRERVPQSSRACILHNDFKLDNCQFDPSNPDRLKSIFDWDMATLGDPLVDLGTVLNYWPDDGDDGVDRALFVPGLELVGLPTRTEIAERYLDRMGLAGADVGWYEAFACWRTAVILQQLSARYARGESTDERMASMGEPVHGQCARAAAVLDRTLGTR